MKKIILYAFVVFAIGGSCKKSTSTKIITSEDIIVEEGSCTNFTKDNRSYTVCFEQLITDSRCPTGEICVWDGYAKATFSLTQNTQKTNFNLATLSSSINHLNQDTIINPLKIFLAKLTPRISLINPQTAKYKATLRIE